MTDIGEILERKKPQKRKVLVLLDPELRDEYDELEKAVGRAELQAKNSNDRAVQLSAEKLREEIEAKKLEMDEASVEFTFQAIGRLEFNELWEAAQPPTEEDKAAGLDFQAQVFVPALLAASSVEPSISLKDAETIFRDWSDAEVVVLFNAAFEANKVVRGVPSTAPSIGRVLRSAPSSTTPRAAASRTRSS